MKQSLRISGDNDYIALDFTNDEGYILSTPFYISNNRQVEVHWGRPSSEQCENPYFYDDFNDRYLFKMIGGQLSVAWLNGPCFNHEFTNLDPKELIDWKFQYAHKILPAVKIPMPVS